jgi:hypothetical protein
MRNLLLGLVTLVCPVLARAQCCLGAQNGTFDSRNGRYRVEAASRKGTGPAHHGPYSYRFRFLARAGDMWAEQGSFDAEWNTHDHFSMRVLVSPTGNGFLLDVCREPVEFRTRDGHVVSSYRRSELQLAWAPPADGRLVGLIDPESVPLPGHRGMAHTYVPCGSLFLPFGAPVGPELEQRILALFDPALAGEADCAHIETCLAQLHGDRWVRAAAEEQLLRQGAKAVPALEVAAATGSEEQRLAAAGVLAAIRARTAAGHAAPARNLGLLGALLTYPSAKVATLASTRIDALLPDAPFRAEEKNDLTSIADWLEGHAHEFAWNEAKRCYERR